MNIGRPSEKNLFMAIYKATSVKTYNEEIYTEPEDVQYHKFFTKVKHEETTLGDIEQVELYKSNLYKLLGTGCISPPPTLILDEIDRIDKWLLLK